MQTVQDHGTSAIEALRRGDAAAARASFEQAISSGRAGAQTFLGLAIACDNMGDSAGAGAALDQALKREPNNLRALILKADILDRSGDMRAAGSFYQAALNGAKAAGGQLPQDLIQGLTRAQNALKRHAEQYEAHLREAMAAKGYVRGEETQRFGQSLDLMFGKSQIYFQEPKFYYYPGLPQIQFYPRSDFPWMDAIEAATDAIREELMAVMAEDGAFVPYVQSEPNRPHNAQGGMLDNPAWSAFYFYKSGVLQADNAARCPKTMEALRNAPIASIEGRTPTVLFSLLKGGARIPPHHGFVNTRLICHLPLIVPQGCGFRVGNETREWQEGKGWAFDDTIEHEAWNRSDRTRVILLFDIWRPELSAVERDLIATMFGAIDSHGSGGPAWTD